MKVSLLKFCVDSEEKIFFCHSPRIWASWTGFGHFPVIFGRFCWFLAVFKFWRKTLQTKVSLCWVRICDTAKFSGLFFNALIALKNLRFRLQFHRNDRFERRYRWELKPKLEDIPKTQNGRWCDKSLTPSHSHSNFVSLSRTLTLSLSLSLSRIHSQTHLAHSLTLILTSSISHENTLSISHFLTLALSHSHFLLISHTLSLTHFLTSYSSLPHSLIFSLSRAAPVTLLFMFMAD